VARAKSFPFLFCRNGCVLRTSKQILVMPKEHVAELQVFSIGQLFDWH
jgi:hypothetical protein